MPRPSKAPLHKATTALNNGCAATGFVAALLPPADRLFGDLGLQLDAIGTALLSARPLPATEEAEGDDGSKDERGEGNPPGSPQQ